ncbi:MAG: hypothetical protein Unbinned6354contig1000_26 [Prokaryotic dsDNA virus sp.]|nr:hypothetical protein [Cytophagaceae bacterium]QDP54323.1 MAG: hypothetical protein Unbinned6354contig1000_26 [Prokaryotic dsDNA virus sp.]|tara:strand:+ start:3304 stop:3537 length:234 start_codon:yes stop_codon:yes gene_type:complete
MGHHFNCHCAERQKPLLERKWEILQYKWNSGAFVKGDGEPSDYSTIVCHSCDRVGRTKAAYIDRLFVNQKQAEGETL